MEYLVVLLIVAVFLQTRLLELRHAIFCLAAQSAAIAGTCVLASWGESGLHALLPGLLTLAVKVVFIPGALLRLAGKITDEREILPDSHVNGSTLAAAAFLVLGYLLVDRALPGTAGRDVIAAAVFMMMTGLSLMVLRKRAIMQAVGLITLENGIYLLGLLMTEGLPLVVELGVFLDVLIAALVLVILTNRMSLSFMTTDTTVMKKLKG